MSIPEIADDFYQIDDAIKTGYAWNYGPFEIWDNLGIEEAIQMIKSCGEEIPNWINDMVNSGAKSFYIFQDGKKKFSGEYFKGKEHGKWEGWHPNGNKKYEGSYDDGFQVGLWTYYDAKGKKNLEETYFSEPIYQKGQISETKEY